MQKLQTLAARPAVVFVTYFVCALLLGKLIVTYGPGFAIIGDANKYLTIARGLLEGTYPVVQGDILPPIYPLLLATVFLIFGVNNYAAGYIAQYLLLSGIAFFTYRIATKHLGVPALLAGLAGLAIIVWPYFNLYSLLFYSEVLYTLILSAAMYLLLEAYARDDSRFFAGAGILIGIATLTRPVALLLPFWLVGFIVLACLYRRQLTRWWKQIAIALTAFIITLAPWSLYVFSQTGVPTPVSTHFSSVQQRSLNLTYEPWRDNQPVESAGIGTLVQSKLLNVVRFWNPGAGGTQAESLIERVPLARIAIYLYYIGFLTIVALAFLSLRFPHARTWVIYLTILYGWSVHTVLYPYPRYTLPFIPLVLALATYTLHQLYIRYYALRSTA